MATKKRKKPMNILKKWSPEPNDAIRLAALRWFALEIERLGIEIYATDKDNYRRLEKMFRGTLTRMASMSMQKKKKAARFEEDECPEGFILCKDGFCAPMCDGISG